MTIKIIILLFGLSFMYQPTADSRQYYSNSIASFQMFCTGILFISGVYWGNIHLQVAFF